MSAPPLGTAALRAVIFDIGDTLIHAASPTTATAGLTAAPIGDAIADLRMLGARYRLAAVTDTWVMTAADVRDALDRSGFEGLLDPIITSVDIGAAKPDPRGLLAALRELEVTPEEALFIGNADVDRQAAAAAAVPFALFDGTLEIGAIVDEHVARRQSPRVSPA